MWPAWEPQEVRALSRPRWGSAAGERAGLAHWLTRGVVRAVVPAALVYSTFTGRRTDGWQALLAALAIIAIGGCVWGFNRVTRRHRLGPSLALTAVMLGAAALAQGYGYTFPVAVLAFGCALVSMQRMPLAAGLPTAAIALGGYCAVHHEDMLSALVTVGSIGLGGWVLRLDAGSRHRLRLQERAAHVAEAESAALSERARIARDIHDVLAHSLSAQLVHLEAARLRIEQEPPGPFRDQILQRVVGARAMARDGLAETRQALSALRGDMAPLGDYLRQVAVNDGAEVEVSGIPRPVPAEASQTVRRVVQEALTNVRKHAPGARVRIDLTYGSDELSLAVRDYGGTSPALEGLDSSGSGYGLLGMRERAELLGGTLEAGPEPAGEKGYTVRLRVPA
jgi:signal transduction histidine kinase